METIIALLGALSLYLVLTTSALGWGLLVARLIRADAGRFSIFDQIWLGWAGLLVLLQVCHFFVALSAIPSLIIYSVGLALFLASLRTERARLVADISREPLLLMGFGAFALLVAWRSLETPVDFDSGLYHLDALRWINQFAIVPGLGNLHDRLAFNYSYFPFVASLNLYPWFDHGYTLAFGWLILVLALECLQALARLIHNVRTNAAINAVDLVPALLSPYVVFWGLATDLSSPQPNRAAAISRLVLFVYLWRNACAPDKAAVFASTRMIFVLGAAAVTLKISNIAIAGVAGVAAVLHCVWFALPRPRPALLVRELLPALLFSAVTGLIWMTSGIITSGYPAYPSTVLPFSTDWTIDPICAQRTAAWIYSWARLPGVDPTIVLKDSTWFHAWLSTYRTRQCTELLWPAALVVLSLLVPVLILFLRRASFPFKAYALLLTPLAGSLALWFISAPDPRFFEGTLWLVLLGVLTPPVCASLHRSVQPRAFAGILALMSLPLVFSAPSILDNLAWLPRHGWQPLPPATFEQKVTTEGLSISVPPKPRQQSWGRAFPSTPYFHSSLQQRGSSLQSGFRTLSHLAPPFPDQG